MKEDRLNALLLLYVHRDIKLDFDKIIDDYAMRNPRKMVLMNPLYLRQIMVYPQNKTSTATERHGQDSRNVLGLCPLGFSENTQDLMCKKMLPFEKPYKNPCWHADSGELLCLPYFMLIGMPKCGTTDIFYSIIQHPDVEYPVNKFDKLLKETHFFDALHYGLDYGGNENRPPTSHEMRFEHYVQAFRRAASVISMRSDVITGEATPGYLQRLYNWIYIPQTENRPFPIVSIPHTIQHILPRVKIIISLRDPVERSQSAYFCRHRKHKRVNFDKFVKPCIHKIEQCFKRRNPTDCIMDTALRKSFRLNVNDFLIGLYYYYIKVWMDVFTRDQFLFVPFEEYTSNKHEMMNKIFSFLELRPLSHKEMKARFIIQKKWKNKSPQLRYTPMNESSYDVLHDFYRPFNEKLNRFLKDEFNYTWKKEQYNMYRNRLKGFATS
ncbi:carbohydrate sulfotransferase 15-like [Mytilus trossulus]|uniref:carbohydrate sulfotransferase 15-like n=1 Tax=Mytilus trossulus TaxID=6551 RepID=UPI003005967F